MKTKALLFAMILTTALNVVEAQGQELPVSDEPIDDWQEPIPTIILMKEGSILSVEVQNYTSNCATYDFVVKSSMSEGSDGSPCSLSVNVTPVLPEEITNCECPFNVSFTVRDFEPNSFYLDCWWYKGLVELKEGEPLVLEDVYEDATVDGMNFNLRKAFHQAMLTKSDWVGEVRIPSELSYEGQTYSVTSIYCDAFTNNTTMTKVFIPRTIKSMDFSEKSGFNRNPFARCSALKSIEVEEGNPVLCTVDGVLFNKEKTRLYCYPAADSRTSYTVPEGVTWIEGSAFASNHHLVTISLPDGVTYLGASAFYDCTYLEEVNLPSGLKSLAGYMFWNCEHLKSVTIPDGVTHLGNNLFNGCTSLTSVTMPKSVATTGYSIFADCTSLKSVTLSPNLEEINHSMFQNCSSLTDIQIPKSVTSVMSNAFKGCKTLKLLDLPESVTRLGDYVFSGCKLDSLLIRGVIDFRWTDHHWLFDGMGTQTKVYVHPTQVDKFKAIYKGPVYPLPEQKETAYYYYNGKKIPLTLNEDRVVVSIPKDCDGISKRIRANVPVLSTIKDEVFDCYIISRSDFEYLTTKDFWEEDAKSVVLTSSYYTEENKEVFETPYLNVELKKEEDAYLLDSYTEKYRLRNLGSFSQYLPKWYVLYVTPESDKSPLQCANELYESGDFAASVPDLTSDYGIGETYRPFVEESKVWKVGSRGSGNPVQLVEYYYFEGDTIIDGKTCKQMMCQRFVSPEHPDYAVIMQYPLLRNVGAWYEENKKVYAYDTTSKQFKVKYDFSLDTNDTLLIDNLYTYMIGPKQTGGLKGFKGAYRDIVQCWGRVPYYNTTWLEGVGGIDGPTVNVYYGEEDHTLFLMSCAVGDEVIYLNDEYEDGATPEGARKSRFDFTHTIKTRPKVRGLQVPSNIADGTEASGTEALYGEYNALQLDINLDPLDDAYQVSITDGSGKAVYEKAVNTGTVVALSIDISSYAKGRYTVTVENSEESFTGQFEAQTTKMRLGDLNGDGAVDVADIATVISVMANGVESANVNGDVNGDGVVDVADIASVIAVMAGKTSE